MIRGQIQLPDERFRELTGLANEFIDWLRESQNQLVSFPEVLRTDDLDSSNFPNGEGYQVIATTLDIYVHDQASSNWASLRYGITYNYGDAIPTTAYVPPTPPDHPIGSVRIIHNNTGAIINQGSSYSSGLRLAVFDATGPKSTPGDAISGTWRALSKFSNLEAGSMIKVSD